MIKNVAKKAISTGANFLSLDFLIRQTNRQLILPFYHLISDDDVQHIKHLYPIINVALFKRDLDFFQRNYKSIDAECLKKTIINSVKSDSRNFHLSFDDGLKEFYEVVAPILVERGIAATCFVNPAFVDNKDMFFRLKASVLIDRISVKGITQGEKNEIDKLMRIVGLSYSYPEDLLRVTDKNKDLLDKISPLLNVNFSEYLSEKKPYLTTLQIEDLIKQGFSIGAHSFTHPYYPSLDEEMQVEETMQSINWIMNNFKDQLRLFSFPYTDFEIRSSFFDKIKNDVDLSFGTANLKLDSIQTNLQRIPMEVRGRVSAELIIKSEYLNYLLKKIVNKHIIIRK